MTWEFKPAEFHACAQNRSFAQKWTCYTRKTVAATCPATCFLTVKNRHITISWGRIFGEKNRSVSRHPLSISLYFTCKDLFNFMAQRWWYYSEWGFHCTFRNRRWKAFFPYGLQCKLKWNNYLLKHNSAFQFSEQVSMFQTSSSAIMNIQ